MSAAASLRKIVVGVDGSEASEKALAFAADLAGGLNAMLALTYVLPPIVLSPNVYADLIHRLETQHQEEADGILAKALRSAEARSVPSLTHACAGPPAEGLADYAEAEGAFLIVVGTRGRGAVARVMLGSTSDRLLHISKVPVVVVR